MKIASDPGDRDHAAQQHAEGGRARWQGQGEAPQFRLRAQVGTCAGPAVYYLQAHLLRSGTVLENDLIIQALAGDASAWEDLVRAHQQPVFRLAFLLLGDADEAEDVAQETFIRAHRSLVGFDAGRELRPWLLRIAANLARNRRRSVRRYLAALQRAFGGAPTVVGPPEHTGEEARALWQAIRRLAPADQEVIYLRYFLELSEVEAARALAVAQGTVKSRLSRALGRLRELIDREYPDLHVGREV